jgi:hypothetical protein
MTTVKAQTSKNRKRRRSRLPGVFLSVVLLAAVSVAAAVMITNDGRLDKEGLMRLLESLGGRQQTAAFSFDAGVGAVYAEVDGGLAVCSSAGLQVYNRDAALVYEEAYEMAVPTVSAGGKTVCTYDLGGYLVKVFDKGGVLYTLKAEGKIISATMGDGGWLALTTEGSGVYKSLVSVYDRSGQSVYRFESATGYVLTAAVSPDNGSLAVLTLWEQGSRVVFFSLDSPAEKASCRFDGSVVLDIRYLANGSVVAVGYESLMLVHPNGNSQQLLDYSGRFLVNYTTESPMFTALVLNDYMVGDQGSILTVDRAGNTLGTLQTSKKVLWMSASGDYLVVLYSDGLVLYDRHLKERARFDDTAGAVQTIMRSDGTALLILPHSATVCAPNIR